MTQKRAATTRYAVPQTSAAPVRAAAPTSRALPAQVQRWLTDAVRDGLTGSVTLHFVGGDLRSWERKESGRRDSQ